MKEINKEYVSKIIQENKDKGWIYLCEIEFLSDYTPTGYCKKRLYPWYLYTRKHENGKYYYDISDSIYRVGQNHCTVFNNPVSIVTYLKLLVTKMVEYEGVRIIGTDSWIKNDIDMLNKTIGELNFLYESDKIKKIQELANDSNLNYKW